MVGAERPSPTHGAVAWTRGLVDAWTRGQVDASTAPFFSSFFLLLNTGIPRKGRGGFNPCPNVFGALFYGALYLGKMTKRGGGVEGLAKRFGSILKVLYG